MTRTTKKATAKRTPKAEIVLVRSRDAGVHFGELVARNGDEVTLHNSRRIYYWKGAATLSELAVYGPKFPADCRFGAKLPTIDIRGWCEIIACQPAAVVVISGVAEWRA